MAVVERDGACVLAVRVIPRSSRSEIVGLCSDAIKVKLASPPVDGAANAELIKLFAKHFGVTKSSVHIIAGQNSRSKTVSIDGIAAADVLRLIAAADEPLP